MNISLKWLKSLIYIDLPTEDLCHKLTMSGLEVEGVKQVEAIPGGLKGLVIGQVVTCSSHPNADRLTCTKVNIGSSELLSIVCGAPNVAPGQKVVVAPVGCTIFPTAGAPFEIKKAKIRGELSEGMICAEDEIGLGQSHDGILVLDPEAPIGLPAAEFFKLENDEVIEIGLTPNRGDAASHLGIAKELRVLTSRDWCLPEVAILPEIHQFPIQIVVLDSEACPRYAGILLKGIVVGESPDWMQQRLRSIGLNPINSVVDVTNYVLHEMGQPIHAFDAAQIKGNKVIVRTAKQGEKITTLDDKEHQLQGFELLICNDSEPMAIAGVFGGKNSGVSETTSSVFIESAYFDPTSIRRTAKKHGLTTDASFRYERGTDPEIAVIALKRVVHLLQQTSSAQVASGLIDHYPKPISPFQVQFRPNSIERIGGIQVPDDRITSILESLDIKVTQNTTNEPWILEVPAYRPDVKREADIIEEVLRIEGLDTIPIGRSMHLTPSLKKSPSLELKRKASNFLMHHGCNEIMNNSLGADEWHSGDDAIRLLNPLSSELGTLRTSMLPNALSSIAFNKNRKNKNLKLFEFGKVYFKNDDSFREDERLLILLSGVTHEPHWHKQAEKLSIYHIKGLVQGMFQILGIEDDPQLLNLSRVSSELLKKFDIKDEVFAAEIHWNKVVKKANKKSFTLKEIPVFPAVKRDLSMIVPSTLKFTELVDVAYKSGAKHLTNVEIFDVYQGKPLEQGEKSYSLSFLLSNPERTMSDKEIDATMQRLQQAFEQKCNARIRK